MKVGKLLYFIKSSKMWLGRSVLASLQLARLLHQPAVGTASVKSLRLQVANLQELGKQDCKWIKYKLADAQLNREFAADAATVLLNDPFYAKVKFILQSC